MQINLWVVYVIFSLLHTTAIACAFELSSSSDTNFNTSNRSPSFRVCSVKAPSRCSSSSSDDAELMGIFANINDLNTTFPQQETSTSIAPVKQDIVYDPSSISNRSSSSCKIILTGEYSQNKFVFEPRGDLCWCKKSEDSSKNNELHSNFCIENSGKGVILRGVLNLMTKADLFILNATCEKNTHLNVSNTIAENKKPQIIFAANFFTFANDFFIVGATGTAIIFVINGPNYNASIILVLGGKNKSHIPCHISGCFGSDKLIFPTKLTISKADAVALEVRQL